MPIKGGGEEWQSGKEKIFIWQVLPFQRDVGKGNCNFVPICPPPPALAFICHLLASLLNFLLSMSRYHLDIFFFDLSSA